VDCIPSDSSTHSIGTVRSDPTDGTLWVGSGDGAGFGGVDTQASAPTTSAATPARSSTSIAHGLALPGHAFCPSDTDLTHVCAKVHAAGFRNPFRFTLAGAPAGGGRRRLETAGKRSTCSGDRRQELRLAVLRGQHPHARVRRRRALLWGRRGVLQGGDRQRRRRTQTTPIRTTSEGAAVVGGPTYTGGGYPAQYQGSIFFGDYVLGIINLLVPDGQGGYTVSAFASAWAGVDLEAAPGNGDLVYADLFGGEIRRIKFAATTGEVDYAAGRPTSSSSSENGSLGPEKAVDGDSTTRWSSATRMASGGRSIWARRRRSIRSELNWETAYASQYRIATSTDGTSFTTVANETIAEAGLHATSFAPRSARYVRVTGIARATVWGISFWDARVLGPASGPPPADLARGASRPRPRRRKRTGRWARRRRWDGDSTTRWSSAYSDGQWWQVDLGSAKTIDSVELNWETAYASQYRIATSTDGTSFTTVANETIAERACMPRASRRGRRATCG
jgi:hypothetical protein